MEEYKAKNGKMQLRPSFEELTEASEDGTLGFCLACGDQAEGVEPDAVRDKCECCDAMKVYGADELLLRGIYH